MANDESDSRRSSSSDGIPYQSVPEADRDMAYKAYHEFSNRRYEEAYSFLRKLQVKRPQDSKVCHNLNVVHYYISICTKTDQFLQKLKDVGAHIPTEDKLSVDDVDSCVILYNEATVFYHLHLYSSAVRILEKVYQIIEPLEENLAKNVCFLMLECYIALYQPKKARVVISYMDTLLDTNKNGATNKSSQQKDAAREDSVENGVPETVKRKLQLCKARCYAIMKTSKACKKEIKNLMSSGSLILNIPAFYLKSQLEYQRGNYRKALKLLNSITLPADISQYFKETGDCLPAIFYNNVGCIHFYTGKPNLGQFYTEKALNEFDSLVAPLTNTAEKKRNIRPLHLMSSSTRHQLVYNLGMQYLQARKFDSALTCFTQVMPLYFNNPRLWLRMAECCIHLHHPTCTEELTEITGKQLQKSVIGSGPHRKLIMKHTSATATSTASSSSSSELPSLHMAHLYLKNAWYLVEKWGTNPSGGGETPLTTLESTTDDTSGGEVSSEEVTLSVLPANYLQGPEIQSLKNSILIAAAYVSLTLGDVILTHEYVHHLLNQPKISSAHKFLAHQYAGEALLLGDHISDALDYFHFKRHKNIHVDPNDIELAMSVNNTSELSLKHQIRFDSKLSEKNEDGSRPVGNIPNWMPNTMASSMFVTRYNLAVAYAVREEWSKALDCLLQMNPGGSVPRQALSLLVYVQCHQGCAEDIKTYVDQTLYSIKA